MSLSDMWERGPLLWHCQHGDVIQTAVVELRDGARVAVRCLFTPPWGVLPLAETSWLPIGLSDDNVFAELVLTVRHKLQGKVAPWHRSSCPPQIVDVTSGSFCLYYWWVSAVEIIELTCLQVWQCGVFVWYKGGLRTGQPRPAALEFILSRCVVCVLQRPVLSAFACQPWQCRALLDCMSAEPITRDSG